MHAGLHFSAMREVVRSEAHNLRSSLGNQPLNCAIIGEFSAGKSSVINALVGRDDFLPVNLTETTALISKLEYSPFPRVELELHDGSRVESSIADYRRLVDQNADILTTAAGFTSKRLCRLSAAQKNLHLRYPRP